MKLTLAILMVMMAASFSSATTLSTPASRLATSLALDLHDYAAKNHGERPATLAGMWHNNPNGLSLVEGAIGAKIDVRFRILEQPVIDPEKGRIVVITRDVIHESRREGDGLGRYVVWFKESAHRASWETEAKMQTLFTQAGLTLESSGLWKQILHPNMHIWLWIIGGAALLIVAALALKRRSSI